MMTRDKFSLFRESFPNLAFVSYVFTLRKVSADCRTVLDIGCGASSPIRFLNCEHSAGVDGHEPSIAEAKRKGTHDEFHLSDVKDVGKNFCEKEFDCCAALDVIEHLTKKGGYKLIWDMEKIATKKVVIFTPNGYMAQRSEDGDLQEHLCGWEVDEMKKLGYSVVGIYGHKFLRREAHCLRFRPKLFWGVISEATHYLYTRSHPKYAAAILCIKNIG